VGRWPARPLLHGFHDLARELRREVGLARERGAQRNHQLDWRRMLEHEARGSGVERAPGKAGIAVHGEKHDGHAIAGLSQLDQGVDAIQIRHGDVTDDHVRAQFSSRLDQGAPVFHHAHKIELGRQQADRLGQPRSPARPGAA